MSFVVDPTSISEAAIFDDLKAFVDSSPDAASWQTFFESSVGVTTLKLLSGTSAFFTYNNIVGRREAYIQYAQNRSSIIGGGQQLGYSAFRGKNPIVDIRITSNFTGTIERFSVIGGVKSQELIALETKVVNIGESATIRCVVGDLKSETLNASSSLPALFRFTGNGTISDDVRVLVDDVEVGISERVLDIENFKYIVQTNAVGSVDVFSDNSLNLPVRYDTGSVITLEWIELKAADFEDADFVYNFGDILEITTISIYQSIEDKEIIRINSRLQNEVQFTIRAREDQPKQFRQLDTSIIDSKGEDVSAAIMRIYYLRENGVLFDDEAKTELVEKFEPFRPFGLLPPIIADPTRKTITVKVDAVLQDSSGDPENDIAAIVKELENKLEVTINLEDLEKDIESLSNIKIARPTISGNTWVNDNQYEIGEFVTEFPINQFIYQALEILYFSDATEPTWPTVAGTTIIDNDIVWVAVAKNDTAGIVDWTANTIYRPEDLVRPTVANGYVYRVQSTINRSEASEPVWPALGGLNPIQAQGQFIKDGDILWITKPLEGTPAAWAPNAVYTKGTNVVAIDQATTDTEGMMFQAFAYLGTSGGSITFPTTLNQTIDDNNIRWGTQSPSQLEFESGIGGYFNILTDITLS